LIYAGSLLPRNRGSMLLHYFSDVTEKIAIVVGTFVFLLVAEITNSMRNSFSYYPFSFTRLILSFMRKTEEVK
jgi:UMF1 family MFS transporter